MSLISRTPKEEELFVATQTVYLEDSPNALKPSIYRGEAVAADNHRRKSRPDVFEPAPADIWRGPEPKPDEAAAIAQTPFVASDGAWVFHGRRFFTYDRLVREHAQFFAIECPE